MKFHFIFIMVVFILVCSCGEDTVNNTNEPAPLYSHSTIELSGSGLQEYRDTIPLEFINTDSIYVEFWSESNTDSMDQVLLNVAVYDTIPGGSIYLSNFFTENTNVLNNVHGFGFKMVNSTIKLEINVNKGSLDDNFLRLRNFNIYKK